MSVCQCIGAGARWAGVDFPTGYNQHVQAMRLTMAHISVDSPFMTSQHRVDPELVRIQSLRSTGLLFTTLPAPWIFNAHVTHLCAFHIGNKEPNQGDSACNASSQLRKRVLKDFGASMKLIIIDSIKHQADMVWQFGWKC